MVLDKFDRRESNSDSLLMYESLIQNCRDGIAILEGKDGTLVYRNKGMKLITGREDKDAIGHSFLEFIENPIPIDILNRYNYVLSEGKDLFSKCYSTKISDVAGNSLDVELSFDSIGYEGNRAAILVLRDVTETLHYNKLKVAAEAGNNLSHELATPFSVLLGHLNIMQHDYSTGKMDHEAFEKRYKKALVAADEMKTVLGKFRECESESKISETTRLDYNNI
jgi:PAS domain S-box-containing protein